MQLPTLFVSHGGGPWPFVDEMKEPFARTAEWLRAWPGTLPANPSAILAVSGHWEEDDFTVASSEHPPMVYDYYNFPEHTYRIRYAAPGSASIATRVRELLTQAGVASRDDPVRGFDHGTFVPLFLMYPNADVPVVSLSLRTNLDPLEHIRMGEALAPLRDEGILILGSGLSYHNLRMFRQSPAAARVSEQFEHWLTSTVSEPDIQVRAERLAHWEQAPAARLAHPREDHLIPLMVAAGAAGQSRGRRVFLDTVWGIAMASYQFGG
jgi:aromatic ring-opening dioxygenase catalytic subunit (LigB family)